MAEPEVRVIFGASVQGLLAGVAEAKSAIEELRAPIDEFVEGLSGIAEAMGLTFAVEKISEWAQEAAEAGEHAVNLGAALNLSAEAANNLSGMMSIVGANADTAIRLFGQLSRAIDEALTNKSGRRAFAFEEAGIDPEHLREVISGPDGIVNAIEILGKAWDDLKARGGDTSVAGPLGVLIGARQFAEIDKLISKGKEFREALKEVWASTAPPSNEGLERLDHLAEQFHTLSAAVENLGKAMIDSLSGPLGAFTEWATKTLAVVTRIIQLGSETMPWKGEEPSASAVIPDHPVPGTTAEEAAIMADIKQRESGGDYRAIGKPTRFGTAKGGYQIMDETWRRWASSLGIDTSRYPTANDADAAMQDMVALQGLRTEGQRPWAASAEHSHLPEGAGAGGITRFDQFTKDKGAYEDLQKSIAEGGAREIAEIEKQIAESKAKGEGIERERFLYSDLSAAKIRMYTAEDAAAADFAAKYGKHADEVLKSHKDHAAQELAAETALINEMTKLRNEDIAGRIQDQSVIIKDLNQREAAELKQTDRLMQLHQIDAKDAEQKELEKVESHRKAVDAILQQELILAAEIPPLRRRINEQIAANDLETTRKTDEIKTKFQNLETNRARSAAETLTSDLAPTLTSVVTGREPAGQAFAKMGESILQKVMNNVIEKLITENLANLLQQLASDVSNTGILSTLLMFILAKPGIGASGGWVVPSFQSGGVVATLHSNEMVLPSHISQGFQDMFRNGSVPAGGGPNISIHAIDTQSGSQFLMQHGPAVAQAWRSGGAQGSLSPRAISSGGRYP